MLAKQHRLIKEKDFKKIFKLGKAYYTKLLGVKTLASQFRFNRFGIIVSSKISKKATKRNRLKRQIRQALGELDKKLIVGLDLAVIALPGLLDQDYKIIRSELGRILVKLKLFK